MINIKKKYQTRSGKPVTLVTDQIRLHEFPLMGYVGNSAIAYYWTADGKYFSMYDDSENDLIEVGLYDDFKKDDKVVVIKNGVAYSRHFSHVDSAGNACVFFNGKTSWTANKNETAVYTTCRKPTADELMYE